MVIMHHHSFGEAWEQQQQGGTLSAQHYVQGGSAGRVTSIAARVLDFGT